MHFIIHSFDDPVHAPLAIEAAKACAEIVPAVSHAIHMPTRIFIQHGMWNGVAHQNVRTFDVAKDLWGPGDSPGDMAHSGDWGPYGFLQLGDYEGARERMRAFEALATRTKHPRATGVLAQVNARYIVETEEWKEPVADTAPEETILTNGMSAARTGELATADRMLAAAPPRARGRASSTSSSKRWWPRLADRGTRPSPCCTRPCGLK